LFSYLFQPVCYVYETVKHLEVLIKLHSWPGQVREHRCAARWN